MQRKSAALSPRERVRLALAHRETDRAPIAMVCSGINAAARQNLAAYLQTHRGLTIEQYLDPLLDIKYVAPRYVGPPLPDGADIWGVRRAPASHGVGVYYEIAHRPLAHAATEADIAAHVWPQTSWFDYDAVAAQIRALDAQGEHCLIASNGNIFETSWYMRGFENIFIDLATDPDLVHALFERVTTFYVEHFTRILAAGRGRIDLVFTADDIGGQNGLLMSLDMWERQLKPYHVRLNRALHAGGARVIYHSDGAVMEAVPGLLDMGIDILQALQFDAQGMDPLLLKARYGDRLCFQGGVSVQRTLPFGTPEEVRREVRHLITTLGRNGGYIVGPSHVIQDGTPPENIVALFDTAAGQVER
jgi:uroporphyrinogen decarboxylase